ncbi:hypothetical protein KEM52_003140 [Ascosphaera acerosa]|nr:hypothetical protein KEM52_003140 [Ascosphaera acerosa]
MRRMVAPPAPISARRCRRTAASTGTTRTTVSSNSCALARSCAAAASTALRAPRQRISTRVAAGSISLADGTSICAPVSPRRRSSSRPPAPIRLGSWLRCTDTVALCEWSCRYWYRLSSSSRAASAPRFGPRIVISSDGAAVPALPGLSSSASPASSPSGWRARGNWMRIEYRSCSRFTWLPRGPIRSPWYCGGTLMTIPALAVGGALGVDEGGDLGLQRGDDGPGAAEIDLLADGGDLGGEVGRVGGGALGLVLREEAAQLVVVLCGHGGGGGGDVGQRAAEAGEDELAGRGERGLCAGQGGGRERALHCGDVVGGGGGGIVALALALVVGTANALNP